MFEFPGLVIPDAGHQADLMVDQNERGIVRGQRGVGLALIGHRSFLHIYRYVGPQSSISSRFCEPGRLPATITAANEMTRESRQLKTPAVPRPRSVCPWGGGCHG